MIQVRTETEGEAEGRHISLMVAGNNFLSFFNIKLLAGTVFQQNRRTLDEEMTMDMINNRQVSSLMEAYVINFKAAQIPGFQLPEGAIGKTLYLHHDANMVNYINKGVVVVVTDDFNYTTTFEDAAPLIILQHKLFQTCFIISLSPDNPQQVLQAFHTVWE